MLSLAYVLTKVSIRPVKASPVTSELSHVTSMLHPFPRAIELESQVIAPDLALRTLAMMLLTAPCGSGKLGGACGLVVCEAQVTASVEALKLIIVAS